MNYLIVKRIPGGYSIRADIAKAKRKAAQQAKAEN